MIRFAVRFGTLPLLALLSLTSGFDSAANPPSHCWAPLEQAAERDSRDIPRLCDDKPMSQAMLTESPVRAASPPVLSWLKCVPGETAPRPALGSPTFGRCTLHQPLLTRRPLQTLFCIWNA